MNNLERIQLIKSLKQQVKTLNEQSSDLKKLITSKKVMLEELTNNLLNEILKENEKK